MCYLHKPSIPYLGPLASTPKGGNVRWGGVDQKYKEWKLGQSIFHSPFDSKHQSGIAILITLSKFTWKKQVAI